MLNALRLRWNAGVGTVAAGAWSLTRMLVVAQRVLLVNARDLLYRRILEQGTACNIAT